MNNMKENATLELDDLDLMLARELELDARQSNRVLAKKLATSQMTVARRLERLLDAGVIHIATYTDPFSLGFSNAVVIGLNVSAGKTDEVVDYLRAVTKIQNIILTTGRYDIWFHTSFHNRDELSDFIYEYSMNVPYLVSAEAILFLDRVKMSWKYLNGDTERYHPHKPRHLDELDIRLIKELELSPRDGIMNLGRKLGVNRNLVSRRLQALLADDIIRVVSFAKPSFFGLKVQVFIFVKVQPDKLRSVANNLIAETRVRHIYIIAGPFALLLNAAFQDMEEMSDFLRNHLGNYPGVISHEILIQVAYAKRSFSLLA